mmetsp:Transcript_1099/g.2522  ORF Transcript_1099/g.2522 Transcript_1099/m.2522 type:complete len:80 (+) Transcript_1099:1625-1864(+)
MLLCLRQFPLCCCSSVNEKQTRNKRVPASSTGWYEWNTLGGDLPAARSSLPAVQPHHPRSHAAPPPRIGKAGAKDVVGV